MGMIPWDMCSFDVCNECDGCQDEPASVYKNVREGAWGNRWGLEVDARAQGQGNAF